MGDSARGVVWGALENVLHDLGALTQRIGPVDVRQVRPSEGLIDTGSDAEWLTGLPDGQSRWVLSAGSSETAIDAESLADLTADIASYLQDAVVDATGRPWPDVDGVGVLDAGVIDGAAWWMRNGSAFARIGELAVSDQ